MNNAQQNKNHILKNKKSFVKCLLGFNIFRYIPKYFGYKKRVESEFDTSCVAK